MFPNHVLYSLSLCVLGVSLLPAEELIPTRREPARIVKQLGTLSLRHGLAVRAIVFDADGKTLFSAAADGTISRWDATTGQEQARFVGHVGRVRTLALSPDGQTLLSGGSDGTVRLFEVPASEPTARPHEVVAQAVVRPGHSAIESLAFHPSGQTFLAGLEEGKWLRYDTATQKEQADGEVGDPVRILAPLADGKELLTSRANGGLVVWQMSQSRRLRDFAGETAACLALSPDGSRAVVGDFAGNLSVVLLAKGVVLWKKPALAGPARRREVTAVAFAPDGKSVVSAGLDGSLRVWNAVDGTPLGSFAGQSSPVYALAFAPDGKALMSGDAAGLLQRWNPQTREPIGGLASAGKVRSLSLTSDGRLTAVLIGGRVELFQGRKLTPIAVPPVLADGKDWRALHFLDHSRGLLLQSADGAIVRAATSGKADRVPVLPASVRGERFVVVADTLAAISDDRRVHLIDLSGKEPHRKLSLDGDSGKAVALSPDGKYVAAVTSSTILRIWAVATGRRVHEIDGSLGSGTGVIFSPDSRLLLAAGRDRMVAVIEVATGNVRQEIPIDGGYPTSLALTPDGRFLAVGTSSGLVGLYDHERGLLLDQIEGHRGEVTTLAFQADTNALFSVGAEGVLFLHDVAPILKANRPQPLSLTRHQLEEHWSHLGQEDARGVTLAIQALVRAAPETIAWLRTRVQPVEARQVQQLLIELGSDDFEVRDRAMRELGRMGKAIERTLKAGRESPDASLDKRVRIEELLDRIVQNRAIPEYLQSLRAIEVLERIGTAEAKQVLEKVAGGLAEAEVTIQARAALARLRERR